MTLIVLVRLVDIFRHQANANH